MQVFTVAAAKAKTSGSGLVAAPAMKRRLENRLAVPHSSLTPVASILAAK
jgi:hypothetical protein